MRRAESLGRFAVVLAIVSCRSERAAPSAASAAPAATDAAPRASASGSVAAPASARAMPSASASAEGAEGRITVMRMTLTSSVEHKEPTDRLDAARAGRRVFAHLLVRNRTDWSHTLKLSFSVGGEVRTTVPLDVQPSWSFRTWGYCTLRDTDRAGTVSIRVTDDEDGTELASATLPIRP